MVYRKQQIIYAYAAAPYIIALILGLLCLATHYRYCNAATETPINKVNKYTTWRSLNSFYMDNVYLLLMN